MISFVIPAKDEEKYINDCLLSIYAQKSQVAFEVIVVDNNSTDKTAEVVKRNFPKVKLVKESVCGTNPARQRGLLAAAGDVVIFLDADVRLPDSWLDAALSELRKNFDTAAVSGPYRYYDFRWYWDICNELMLYLIVFPWWYISSIVLRKPGYLLGGCMVIKKDVLLKIGGFNVELKFYGDELDTAQKLHRFGKVRFCRNLGVYSSARRYNQRGVVLTLLRYWLNYFWMIFVHRPYNLGPDKLIR